MLQTVRFSTLGSLQTAREAVNNEEPDCDRDAPQPSMLLLFPTGQWTGNKATQRHWVTYPSACNMLTFIILMVALPKLVAWNATFCVPAWVVYSRLLGSWM